MSNPFTESDRERMSKWCEHPDGSVPYNAICRLFDSHETLRAELAELRARVPAICFPRQPNGEGGWVIDANYVAAIRKDCFPIEWQPCEEEVEAVLLAVERAAPVTPAAVPEDVAKDAARYRWLRDGDNGGVLSVGALTGVSDMGWERVTWIYDEALDAAIDAAILSAKEKGQ